MNKSGFTVNTKDFDIKMTKIATKKIPESAARATQITAAMIISDALLIPPTVPKSRGITKEGGKRGQGPGHLRRTQKIEKPKITHGEISIELGFDADYAAYVHEMPETTSWTTPGSGPKYLEDKLKRFKDKYARKQAEVMRRATGD